MNFIKETVIPFFLKETVFCIASIIAIITMFFVHPSLEYIDYIDFRVLALLFCLMTIIAGFNSQGVFEKIIPSLFKYAHNTRSLAAILVLSCFFLSMLVTNDVALITLVPFTIMILNKIKKNDLLIPVIVMQTVAANLGSMCTPIGNPQNLYLYTISGISIIEFTKIMLPLSLASLFLIIITMFLFKKEPVSISENNALIYNNKNVTSKRKKGHHKLICYSILLCVCLGTILHLIDYRITLFLVVVSVLILEWRLLLHVDYMLLLTFVAFFLFVGNLKNIPAFYDFIGNLVLHREIPVSILTSQIISNVPAAVLLSGFTPNTTALFIGTNLGGLGTLIASMASLISYKYYSMTPNCRKLKYLGVFTLVNIVYLIVLYIIQIIIP